MRVAKLLACLALALAPIATLPAAQTAESCAIPTTIERFAVPGAIGVKWNEATHTLAFGRKNPSGHFGIWLSDLGGGHLRHLIRPEWSDRRHQFPIAFHPSGRWLVVLVEKAEHPGNSTPATPGYGGYSDYWVVTTDGQHAWKLVDMPTDRDHALTHADFSPNGSTFTWTERIKYPNLFSLKLLAGSYRFNIARFVAQPTPRLLDVRAILPGNVEQGGEVESIASDNRTILFHSTLASRSLLATRIYSMDTDSGEPVELTTEGFSQSPTFTASERRIIYMTGAHTQLPGADWWIMDRDGSHKQRLTYMTQRGSPQATGRRQLAGSLAVINDQLFMGDVLTQLFGLEGYIAKVQLKPGCVNAGR